MTSKLVKLTKRRLYKPERKPARKKGVLHVPEMVLAPVGCADARATEIKTAVYSIARLAGFDVGQGSGYDALRDEYTVIGKSRATGKAQDVVIQGAEVAAAIRLARMLNCGPLGRVTAKRGKVPASARGRLGV